MTSTLPPAGEITLASRRKKERDAIKALAAEVKAKAVADKNALLHAKSAAGTIDTTEEATATPEFMVSKSTVKGSKRIEDIILKKSNV